MRTALCILALLATAAIVATAGDSRRKTANCAGSALEWERFRRGYAIFIREWRKHEGFGAQQPDPSVQHVTNSCAMCHNTPKGSAGSGGNAPSYGAVVRNTPHLFGVGIIEAISEGIREKVLAKYGSSRGYIEKSAINGSRILVEATPGVWVDFGRLGITTSGLLDIDPSFVVWFVDEAGKPLPMFDAAGVRRTIASPDVAGFDFYHGFTGWGVSEHQFPTIRTFILGVLKTFFGFPLPNKLLPATVDGHVWAGPSASGRRQIAGTSTPDLGDMRGPDASLVDDLEYFLLNHPRPGQWVPTPEHQRGKQLLASFGCTGCHTPTWQISAKTDLRSLEWTVEMNSSGDLAGATVKRPTGAVRIIEGVYSDFRYHDLGERFWEYTWLEDKLAVRTRFKTPPLWGVASTAPYGHDGASLTLDAVIRRHGGVAETSAQAYAAAVDTDRAAVLAFLEGMSLFSLSDALRLACDTELDSGGVRQ